MNDNAGPALAGQAVLVTGGSSGIGRAIARHAAAAGADVAVTYRVNESGARQVGREIEGHGRRAVVIRLDLRDEESVTVAGRTAVDALGRIDAWINNAGADILTGANATLPNLEKLDLLMQVDLRGTIVASWVAAGLMAERGGVIINMSWDHVFSGMPGVNPQMFAAVKGAVLAFSKSLARSVAPSVRVNVVAPGWIETSFARGLDVNRHRATAESTPLKRWGRPEDVAATVVYLASPAAGFLTGQTICVGGGAVML